MNSQQEPCSSTGLSLAGDMSTPAKAPSRKRCVPDSGHSPEQVSDKRSNQASSPEPASVPRQEVGPTNCAPPPVITTDSRSVPAPRFTFVISSAKPMRLPVIDKYVRRILGPDAVITRSSMADSGKVCRYKTKPSPGHDPILDLNRMLKHQDQLQSMSGDETMKVEHFDPTSKQGYVPPHAIVSGVPHEYDDMDEFKQLIEEKDQVLFGR